MHRIKNNHDFDWKEVQILDSEKHYNKRLISEMIHIIKRKNGLNKQNDTEFLSEVYIPIIDVLSNK